jgi:arylsulfatase
MITKFRCGAFSSFGLLTGTTLLASAAILCTVHLASAADKRPNIVMLMTDDTGWNDFGCYSGGGAGLGHPTSEL